MMKRTDWFLIVLWLSAGVLTADPKDSRWIVETESRAILPAVSGSLGANEMLATAWGGGVSAEVGLPVEWPLAFRLNADYTSGGFLDDQGVSVPGSLTETSVLGGIGLGGPLGQAFRYQVFSDLGISYGSLSSGQSSLYPAVRLGAGLGWEFVPDWLLRFDAAWLQKVGLYGGPEGTVGIAFRLPEVRSTPTLGPTLAPSIELLQFHVSEVFPILRSYYDDHSLGSVGITNTGNVALEEVRVQLLIRQYMDAPKDCGTIHRIGPGETVKVPLYALFGDQILGITEATKVLAEVTVSDSTGRSTNQTSTALVNDRNALTWDDDRKAAAFVSSKDPWVLDLTGNFLSAAKDLRNLEYSKNLQTAMAFHEGLRSYGLAYVLSPTRPITQAVVDTKYVDNLKFPRQTLSYRAGDCADLSVLYASCFEAAGIEAAFITVPGHLFMAIDSGMSLDEIHNRALSEQDFIPQGGKEWVPIETTMRTSDFLEAWHKAASEWREASDRGVAVLYPIHEAWKQYPPVGLPADGTSVKSPPDDRVRAVFQQELTRAVSGELSARIALLGTTSSQGTPKFRNDRGVLYGKYGDYAEAEADFQAAAQENYLPALVNLGNVSLLRGKPEKAFDYYSQAAKLSPDNPRLLVNLARAQSALGKTDEVLATLQRVKTLDPSVAEKYASLAEASTTSGARATEMIEGSVAWF